ncbi:hypothetical protein ERJ75_000582700 [Trypanosoma vivax]|nr:hypothetical protein ERJ75_000582700 [Trypanosoma vivax]
MRFFVYLCVVFWLRARHAACEPSGNGDTTADFAVVCAAWRTATEAKSYVECILAELPRGDPGKVAGEDTEAATAAVAGENATQLLDGAIYGFKGTLYNDSGMTGVLANSENEELKRMNGETTSTEAGTWAPASDQDGLAQTMIVLCNTGGTAEACGGSGGTKCPCARKGTKITTGDLDCPKVLLHSQSNWQKILKSGSTNFGAEPKKMKENWNIAQHICGTQTPTMHQGTNVEPNGLRRNAQDIKKQLHYDEQSTSPSVLCLEDTHTTQCDGEGTDNSAMGICYTKQGTSKKTGDVPIIKKLHAATQQLHLVLDLVDPNKTTEQTEHWEKNCSQQQTVTPTSHKTTQRLARATKLYSKTKRSKKQQTLTRQHHREQQCPCFSHGAVFRHVQTHYKSKQVLPSHLHAVCFCGFGEASYYLRWLFPCLHLPHSPGDTDRLRSQNN